MNLIGMCIYKETRASPAPRFPVREPMVDYVARKIGNGEKLKDETPTGLAELVAAEHVKGEGSGQGRFSIGFLASDAYEKSAKGDRLMMSLSSAEKAEFIEAFTMLTS